jgi:hypothetical protein
MATIKISDLHSAGSELFMDSESYLNELTDEELNMAHGGFITTPYCVIALSVSTITITITTSTIRLP